VPSGLLALPTYLPTRTWLLLILPPPSPRRSLCRPEPDQIDPLHNTRPEGLCRCWKHVGGGGVGDEVGSSLAPVRVLVVEDDPGIAQALVRGLTADGFAVDHADDGTEGLWLAQTHSYQAIVLDLMLPGANGWQICAALREGGDSTPILMLTAKDGEYDEIEGLETGADDYMTKPFSYPVLLTRVRSLIRRAGTSPSASVLAAGDLVLDPAARTVHRGGTEVELSPRAFAVLEYMMNQAGLVVSKQSILANVWDHAFDGDPNIVEVYVSRIRTAVDTAFGRSAIETVRGVGYRLAADGG